MQAGTGNRIDRQEFFTKGKQWLPSFFDRIPFSPEALPIQHLQNDTIEVTLLYPNTQEEPVQSVKVDTHYTKAIADISDQNPKRRVRGLQFSRKNRN